MKTIYIDITTFECHTAQNADGTRIPYETEFFDGKCDEFIEGYRCIPPGYSWTRSDSTVFHGEMIAPWKPYDELDAAQREYELQKLADAENALAILLGGAT
jgi:hypothetical protein